MRMSDLVCMTKEEAAAHEKEVLRGGVAPESIYEDQVVRLVQRRLQEEALYDQYRI